MEPAPVTDAEKNWSIAAHLAPFLVYLVLIGPIFLPLGIHPVFGPTGQSNLFGPKSDFVQAHAKESLNGQISYTIYGLVLFFLPIPLLLFLFVLVLWNMVAGVLAAGRGERYAYWFIFRLVP